MSLKEIEQLAKLCRKHGITSYKADGVELSFDFHSIPLPQPRISRKKPSTVDEALRDEGTTEEDLLFWSSGAASSDSDNI